MAPQFSIETKKIIMDTKLVRQYGTEILSYRLRTVRQKKRMQYEDFDRSAEADPGITEMTSLYLRVAKYNL